MTTVPQGRRPGAPSRFMVVVDGYCDGLEDGPTYEVSTPGKARYRAWKAFREAGYGRGMTFLDFIKIIRVRKCA